MSSPRIYFRKIAPYDPRLPGMSEYQSYDLVTRQVYSPEIIVSKFLRPEPLDVARILCSDAKRGIETAELFKTEKTDLIPLKELREINFSLRSLLTEEEYISQGANLVRRRFMEAWVEDALGEKREQIRRRVGNLVEVMKGFKPLNTLVISHSFFLKIIETVVLHNVDIFNSPERISLYMSPNQKTYAFFGGFEMEYERIENLRYDYEAV